MLKTLHKRRTARRYRIALAAVWRAHLSTLDSQAEPTTSDVIAAAYQQHGTRLTETEVRTALTNFGRRRATPVAV
ncbi:hypothetical protein HZZ00_38065 (plasmid) [Streptomyces sp. NEAU-sy36]|uniref:hypothetical protein n=1 Tax=unclassified Streptomyces TaxID=2593676 RepID=UPI0015D57F94|nr:MULTISPECIES: hypothetical protein [unclassified Streptomyces]QLJ06838.1 hypothetical protein HZZ00_38065 [Streptomyces sp. NEAU-sy36]